MTLIPYWGGGITALLIDEIARWIVSYKVARYLVNYWFAAMEVRVVEDS